MLKENKIQLVNDLGDKVQQVQAVIFTDYRGLNVEEISRLRNELRRIGVEYHVVKNTLIRRVLVGSEEELKKADAFLVGPTAVVFVKDEAPAAAKIVKTFAEENDKLKIKGGMLEKKVIDQQEVLALASLPGREELLAKMLAGFQSPITGFVQCLGAIMQKFVFTLDAIRQQKN